jgi:hypothetical protein
MTEMATTTPSANGEAPLPRRTPKGLLPSTWQKRELKVEYISAAGKAASTNGTLLDSFPAGPILSIAGTKTLLSWDRIVSVELREDWDA